MKKQNKTAAQLLEEYNLKEVPSVCELEANGITVEVKHLRKLNGLKRQLGMYCTSNKRIARESFSPKGGRTEVKLTLPGGEIRESYQNCADNDPYCRRVGVAFALKKALTGISFSSY